eukprot:5149311-Pleurochrysis_carterae.AAC.1
MKKINGSTQKEGDDTLRPHGRRVEQVTSHDTRMKCDSFCCDVGQPGVVQFRCLRSVVVHRQLVVVIIIVIIVVRLLRSQRWSKRGVVKSPGGIGCAS